MPQTFSGVWLYRRSTWASRARSPPDRLPFPESSLGHGPSSNCLGSLLVVKNDVFILDLPNQGISRRFPSLFICSGCMKVNAKVGSARDLHPVPLQWVVLPPSMQLH